jgi:hypothetical protein
VQKIAFKTGNMKNVISMEQRLPSQSYVLNPIIINKLGIPHPSAALMQYLTPYHTYVR